MFTSVLHSPSCVPWSSVLGKEKAHPFYFWKCSKPLTLESVSSSQRLVAGIVWQVIMLCDFYRDMSCKPFKGKPGPPPPRKKIVSETCSCKGIWTSTVMLWRKPFSFPKRKKKQKQKTNRPNQLFECWKYFMFPDLIADNFDLSKILWREFQLMHLKYSNALNGINFRYLISVTVKPWKCFKWKILLLLFIASRFLLVFLALWPFYTSRFDMFY